MTHFAHHPLFAATLFAAITSLAACTEDGTINVNAWGEGFIEEGIPSAEFADGWAVEFERFNVTISDINVGGDFLAGPFESELTEPSDDKGQPVGALSAPVGDYNDASFVISDIEVRGIATKGNETKTFLWRFPTPIRYTDCETFVGVTTEYESTMKITIHSDHLFYDSLVGDAANLRFDAYAKADSNNDGEVSQAELAEAPIGDYDTGSLDIDNLWDFIVEHANSLGHLNGEAHCKSGPVE